MGHDGCGWICKSRREKQTRWSYVLDDQSPDLTGWAISWESTSMTRRTDMGYIQSCLIGWVLCEVIKRLEDNK